MLDPNNGFKPLPQTTLNATRITLLRLYDDDIAALGWMLNIIHFQTDSVPRTLSKENLFAVAALCDKYHWQRAVGLWAEQWVGTLLPSEDNLSLLSNGPGTGPEFQKEDALKEGCEEWLFIAQAFPNMGNYTSYPRRVFDTLVEEIVGEMESSEEASRIPKRSEDATPLPVSLDLVPEPVVARIKDRRNESFLSAISEITRLLLKIELLKNELGYSGDGGIQKKCMGEISHGCSELTIASSVGSSSQAGWDIEASYCSSCIKRYVCPWVLWQRVEKLRATWSYYDHKKSVAIMHVGIGRPLLRLRPDEQQNSVGSVTSRFSNLWGSQRREK
ncbi:hypothetical protein TWF281_007492 [Arthrobotrys megalospora]